MDYDCPRDAHSKKGLCEFHDKLYSDRHSREVKDLFNKWINERNASSSSIYCIGFYIPKGVDFSSFEFNGSISFAYAEFGHILFSNAKFKEADFSNAKFIGLADFFGAEFTGGYIDFYNAEFKEADFPNAKFANVRFTDAKFNKANFSGTEFNEGIADFEGADFSEADFRLAKFKEADFSNAKFKEADFSNAKFNKAKFLNTEFQSKTRFISTDFNGEIEFKNTRFLSSKKGYLEQYVISWNELLEYPNNFDEDRILRLRDEGLYLPRSSEKQEKRKRGTQISITSSNKYESSVLLTLYKWRKKFVLKIIDTSKEYNFWIRNGDGKIDIFRSIIQVQFDYSTFRKRVRFIGDPNNPIQLRSVSFRGVDLSEVEFHNIEWLKKKGPFINRTTIVDEETMNEYGDYQDVSRIYNQLRKNYESKLLFNEASNFFVGEMEAIRKSLLKDKDIKGKLSSIGYFVYKWLALYGESIFLPLIIWTLSMNIIFILLRIFITNNTCSLAFEQKLPPNVNCAVLDHVVDSLAAYFQFPRSGAYGLDTLERIISIPILGTAFIAIRRKFERIK